MAPKKVDKLMTLKVDKLMTLWRPKGGQTNASPAYIFFCINPSAAYILRLFQKKDSIFALLWRNEDDLGGTKKRKYCTKFWYMFWVSFAIKLRR